MEAAPAPFSPMARFIRCPSPVMTTRRFTTGTWITATSISGRWLKTSPGAAWTHGMEFTWTPMSGRSHLHQRRQDAVRRVGNYRRRSGKIDRFQAAVPVLYGQQKSPHTGTGGRGRCRALCWPLPRHKAISPTPYCQPYCHRNARRRNTRNEAQPSPAAQGEAQPCRRVGVAQPAPHDPDRTGAAVRAGPRGRRESPVPGVAPGPRGRGIRRCPLQGGPRRRPNQGAARSFEEGRRAGLAEGAAKLGWDQLETSPGFTASWTTSTGRRTEIRDPAQKSTWWPLTGADPAILCPEGPWGPFRDMNPGMGILRRGERCQRTPAASPTKRPMSW